jgi:tetratricopeptide (TPR) repeat protein
MEEKVLNEAAAYLKRGIACFEKEDYDQAIVDCSESIRLNPNVALSYGVRGDAYRGKKDYDRAIADLTEAVRLDPNNAFAYSDRGLTYLYKEEYDQAIADLETALKLEPDNVMAREALEKVKAAKEKNLAGGNGSLGGIFELLIAAFFAKGDGCGEIFKYAIIRGIVGAIIGGIIGATQGEFLMGSGYGALVGVLFHVFIRIAIFFIKLWLNKL